MKKDYTNRPKKYHASLAPQGSSEKWLTPGKKKIIQITLFICIAIVTYIVAKKSCSQISQTWHEQCVVTNVISQVKINTSPHLSELHVRRMFSLTNGCNLADIDFKKKREEILHKYPIVRNIQVTRKMPNEVHITVEERTPIARINYSESSTGSVWWDCVDADGIVFNGYPRNKTLHLPIIETRTKAKLGEPLTDKEALGLKIIKISTEKALAALELANVDISNETYLIIDTKKTDPIKDNTIKILWAYIYDTSPDTDALLRNSLTQVLQCINTNIRASSKQTYIIASKDRVVASHLEAPPNKKDSAK